MQFVQIGQCEPAMRSILYVVSQGSILELLLFILNINGVLNVSAMADAIIFADDTNLFCSHNQPFALSNITSDEMVKFFSWFKLNKLSQNIKKQLHIISQKMKERLSIEIDNTATDQSLKQSFLVS
jgi:hypothetical protein